MGQVREVLTDTGFFYFLADPRGGDYEKADSFRQYYLENGYSFLLTDLIFAELILRIRYDLDWEKAVTIGNLVLGGPEYVIVDGTGYNKEAAWRDFFLRYDDKRFSFTDCVSFKVMKELGISEVITVDQDFDRVNQGFLPIYL